MPRAPYVLGVDIGGTKLAAAVCTRKGDVVASARAPTEAPRGPDSVIERLIQLCQQVIAQSRIPRSDLAAVGVGCVGPLDQRTGRVHDPPNLPGWIDIPLGERLQAALGLPFFLDNDANAAALGEHQYGAGRGVGNLVYLTLSTGVGGGLIVDGRLWQGANGNAGEIGHSTVAYNGRLCRCGNRGCLEAYVSGTHIAARAKERLRTGERSSLTTLAGSIDRVTALTVVEGVRARDPVALEVWNETLEILAAGLGNVVNIFNPERIILGGGVTQAGPVLFEPLRPLVAQRALPQLMKIVSIVPAQLGENVGVLGAAAVAWTQQEPS